MHPGSWQRSWRSSRSHCVSRWWAFQPMCCTPGHKKKNMEDELLMVTGGPHKLWDIVSNWRTLMKSMISMSCFSWIRIFYILVLKVFDLLHGWKNLPKIVGWTWMKMVELISWAAKPVMMRNGDSSESPRWFPHQRLENKTAYPLVNIQKAIENGHRNSGFSY